MMINKALKRETLTDEIITKLHEGTDPSGLNVKRELVLLTENRSCCDCGSIIMPGCISYRLGMGFEGSVWYKCRGCASQTWDYLTRALPRFPCSPEAPCRVLHLTEEIK